MLCLKNERSIRKLLYYKITVKNNLRQSFIGYCSSSCNSIDQPGSRKNTFCTSNQVSERPGWYVSSTKQSVMVQAQLQSLVFNSAL